MKQISMRILHLIPSDGIITAAATQALVGGGLVSNAPISSSQQPLVTRVQRDRCSSCSDDCFSPAPSPLPQHDSGTHSPRVDCEL